MTSQLAERHETYRTAFEQVRRESVEHLSPLRERAFTRFAENGFPTTRLEAWRFTNVGPIAQRSRSAWPRPATSTPERWLRSSWAASAALVSSA